MEDKTASKTGYKCPPTHSRFSPGVSGNPRGRPKKQNLPGLGEIISEQLNSEIILPELGSVKKKEILLRRMIQRAAKGSLPDIINLHQLEESFKHTPKGKCGYFSQVINLDV